MNTQGEHNLRNRLMEHEFDFDPGAWKSMNTMLNKHNPRRSPLWVSSLLMLTAMVTFLSVAWYAPIEPIKEFFVKTFDLEEETISDQPTDVKENPVLPKKETIEIPSPVFEKPIRPRIRREREKIEVTPLPEMGPFDLMEQKEMEERIEEESAEPIASLQAFLENSTNETLAVNLPKKKKVEAGFFGGGSISVSNGPLIPNGAISPSVGVFAGYNINDKWGVQAEMNFKKGFVQPFTAKEDQSDFLNLPINNLSKNSLDRVVANQEVLARNLTVLEFPVMAKYKINEKSSVMAGVRPSWIHVKDPNSDSNSIQDREPIYEKWDVGLTVGYEVKLSERVAVNVRYNQGVTDLFQENEDTYLNSDIQASVRYSLNP